MEDKKCRICGLADMANQNFYNCNSKLVEKIVAVFPIVLYPNDPLPKHICKKCLVCATTMYTEIERALKNQSKWIANVRSVQPDNSYVKVVDSIEGAMKQTQKIVSKIAGVELGERTVCRMFNIKTDGNTHPKVQNNTSPCLNKQAPVVIQVKPDIDLTPTAKTNLSNREPILHSVLQKPATKITQLTSVLELNGCTLTKLKPTIKPANAIRETEALKEPNETQHIEVHIKEEPPYHEDEYSECSVKCKMCSYRCETVEELAIHQLDHLTLSVTKLSDRRYLDKRIRRGRLIRVAEKKCIRCLNCWRIFVDNKSILHHWSTGDCNFFCQICGKDYASSPKMLREHVLAAHGVSYKSVKLLRPTTLAPKRHIKAETSPQKSELSPNKGVRAGIATPALGDNLSVKVACNICMKVFANFKARNSHMRAHKHPPLLPAQPPPSLADTLLAFNRNNLLPVKDEPRDFDDIPQHIVGSLDGLGPSTSKTMHTPPYGPNPALQPLTFPSPKMIQHRPKNVLFRAANPSGIRTKYVQIRPNPNAIVFKSEPGQVLKVKSLVDLQDPSVSSQQPESVDKAGLHVINTAVAPPSSNGLGVVATPPKDNMNYTQIFNCHPCRGKFSSKLELFRHKRKCTANNLFPCQFCARHFLTSADLQMHIMLLHKGSVSQ